MSINSVKVGRGMDTKDLFYKHGRDLLVSINSGYGWLVT